MNNIKAVGFDLFNTLITVEPHALDEAMNRLINTLRQNRLDVDFDSFKTAHREAALRFLQAARLDGRETHNRFWISAALKEHGHDVDPDDSRVSSAVEAYFSSFFDLAHVIPGTLEMLANLQERYVIGLLSNFTHAPAARAIMERMGLTPFFSVVLISGELGYRKPHLSVFRQLVEQLGVESDETLFVGDDPEPDITGALRAGIRPAWSTYVRDKKIPFAPGMTTRLTEIPESAVPRISAWEDLLLLLIEDA